MKTEEELFNLVLAGVLLFRIQLFWEFVMYILLQKLKVCINQNFAHKIHRATKCHQVVRIGKAIMYALTSVLSGCDFILIRQKHGGKVGISKLAVSSVSLISLSPSPSLSSYGRDFEIPGAKMTAPI